MENVGWRIEPRVVISVLIYSSSRSDGVNLGRRFNANGIKLSIDALEILDVAQSHRVRTFFTRILPPRFMARRRLQKDHRIEVLLDRVLACATETFDFEDVLEPVVVSLAAPTPAVDLIELRCRILSLVPQRGKQDFGFARRQREFHQAHLHLHRQLMLFDKGARGGSGRARQGHDLFFEVRSPEVSHHAETCLRTANDNLAVSMYGRSDYAVVSEEPI